MNNEINKMLLKEKINYDKLKNCFSYEFNETINDFFIAITRFVNSNNKKNINKVKEILMFLRDNVDSFDNDKLETVVIGLLDFKNNIDNKEIIMVVDNLLNDIYYENSDEYKLDMNSFLNYLIYEDKNIRRIKTFLTGVDKNFLVSEQYDSIFRELLNKFNIRDREIKKYYYKVSLLMLDRMGNNLLSKNRNDYLSILDELKIHSEYTDDLCNIISGNYVSDDVLLSRFGVNFSFPYKYDINGVIVKDKGIPNLRQGAITIDKNNTLKMDDAIFFKKNKDNTYTLYVHVSFVPALIDYDSIINKEARRRYKSIYVFDKVVPILSNDLVLNKCSLLKNSYRNTVTFSVKVDKNMNIIDNTFKVSRTNTKVVNNYDYSTCDMLIKNDGFDDTSVMLKNLTVFALNNLDNNGIDVDRALRDNDYYNSLTSDRDISRDMVFVIMRYMNYNISKYFRDRGYPYLYKYSLFKEDEYVNFNEVVNNNKSLIRYDDLVSDLRDSFFDIRLSSKPKNFFELDCYSSSTDPLWKYSALYNQYLINNFIFLKKSDTDSIEEWYNVTRALAKELNLKKQENKNIETVCKSLSKIRSRY